jgi:hypothetical protein
VSLSHKSEKRLSGQSQTRTPVKIEIVVVSDGTASHLCSHSARGTLGPLCVFQGPVAIFNRCLDGPLVIEWLDLDDQHASRRERSMPQFDPRISMT